MKSRTAVLSATVVLFAAACAGSPAAPVAPDWRAAVDALVDEVVTAGEVVGVSVVVLERGSPPYSVTRGIADLESMSPVTAETRFHIGSITKVFTAAAVVDLAERGLLDLDDDVRRHVPELGDHGPPVTLRELLAHTSGLAGPPQVLPKFVDRRHLAFTRGQLLELLDGEPRVAAPGERYAYNNLGYLVLGIVVERVTGSDFDAALAATGAPAVRLCGTEEVIPHRARGYLLRDGAPRHHEPVNASLVFTAGGLCATAEEVAGFFRALARGKVVTPTAFDTMAEPNRLTDGSTTPYGYGLFIDGPRVHHGGDVNGFSAHAAHYRDHDITVVVLTNTRGLAARRLEHRIASRLLGEPQ